MVKRLKVRCIDKTVFEVNRVTLDPLSVGYYDAYCYSNPELNVEYMEHSEWTKKHVSMMMENYK